MLRFEHENGRVLLNGLKDLIALQCLHGSLSPEVGRVQRKVDPNYCVTSSMSSVKHKFRRNTLCMCLQRPKQAQWNGPLSNVHLATRPSLAHQTVLCLCLNVNAITVQPGMEEQSAKSADERQILH